MVDFYVTVVTFRHTEIEEAPVISLIFMIYMEKMECILSFLFLRVAELVPEITGSKKVIIVSDDEKAINYQCYIQNMV